ncbi:MAG TPA: hydrogenase maturation protease [Opitutaceae bacterium]|jgi:hydrogenase maturation protease|nr:hydrogenase maturation protease [Opitutaceae bacterium]
MKPGATDSWLVIGYGNTLREDDGAGPAVAEAIAERGAPGVRALACPQLSPEHAETVAAAGQVIFVDASAAGGAGIGWESLAPPAAATIDGHTLAPGTLLALARQVYGRAPPSFALTIPARRLGFGERLSPETQAGVDAAIRAILEATSRAAPENQKAIRLGQ